MTVVIQIGPHEPAIYQGAQDIIDSGKYSKIVHYYEDGGYDGRGELIAFNQEGMIERFNLCHCSCYSPSESLEASPDEVLSIHEYITKYSNAEVPEVKAIAEYLKLYGTTHPSKINPFMDDFNSPEKFSIEPHGPSGQYALYFGRCMSRHGYRLCNITDIDESTITRLTTILNSGIQG